jgi:stage II sporulation protein D
MNRRAFTSLAGSALVAFPLRARATGGLDIAGASNGYSIRVLLAIDDRSSPQPIDTWHFGWDGRTYRGTFALVPLPDGRSGLVNTLPLDAYLAGVLGKEISASWAPEAQRAQAIVSRTYVFGKLRPDRPYDVVAGAGDQRYDGIENETVEGRGAVDATSGTIVTYGAAPARAVFSSCCGGRTAAAGDVWNTPYPYLQSVADPNCAGTPNYAWDARIATSRIEDAFGDRLASVGDLRGVSLRAAVDPGDRPQAIVFAGTRATFETTPAAFRNSVGADTVRSSFVHEASLAEGGRTLALRGTGRGHGVGLCQWGARILGEQGTSAAAILGFYFPGTGLGRA